ncbi:MAG TPA: VCBS repeat-containing protein, partial [Pseudomonadota bacterium]|nr:VCBS repeat-containing protein [Pseudomonadota bacterium]
MRTRWHVLWWTVGLVACHSSPEPTIPLAIQQVTPAIAPTTGGTIVQLLGSGFTSQSVVAFDGLASPAVHLGPDGSLSASVPAHLGSAGLVDVRVEDPTSLADPAILPKSFRYYFGSLGFVASPDMPTTGTNPWFVQADDLNGDGLLDLVVTNYGGLNLNVFIGKGDGTFRPQVTYSAGRSP